MAAAFQAVFGKDGMFEIGEEIISLQGSAPHHAPQKYRVFKRGYKTLSDVYRKSRSLPNKECIVYENERYNYADLFRHAGALAHFMSHHVKVQKGDRVVIAMRNLPEWITSFVAATSIGAMATPINAWWGAQELDYCLNDAGPVVVLVDTPRWHALLQCNVPGLRAVILVRPDLDGVRFREYVYPVEVTLYADIVDNPAHWHDLPDHTAPDEVSMWIVEERRILDGRE